MLVKNINQVMPAVGYYVAGCAARHIRSFLKHNGISALNGSRQSASVYAGTRIEDVLDHTTYTIYARNVNVLMNSVLLWSVSTGSA